MFQFLKNIIGAFLSYGSCDCGNTFWNDADNPGIDYGNGSGRIICNKCYEKRKSEIDEHNRRVGGVDIKDANCKHEWEQQGSASFWCPKCNSVMALSCQHGGSIACEECVKGWEIRNGINVSEPTVIDIRT